MSFLAVIPARGGSKGVPLKNTRMVNGLPLIAYTIKAALDSALFDNVLVSTDDENISKVAKEFGAEIPFLRPAYISSDFASSDAVVEHALNFYMSKGQSYDLVCKLQPTSPLRTGNHIIEAFDLFVRKNADFVVSVCECEHSPLWSGLLGKDYSMDGFMRSVDKHACRQELPQYYRLNGAIYIGKTDCFIQNGSFIGENGYAYVMTLKDSIDIDTELDIELAEMLLNKRSKDGI